MTENEPENETEHEPENDPETVQDQEGDVTSDPAHDDGATADWSSEGGATVEGPATETEDDAAGS